mmetsp:Transcript_1013/g.1602  ORF Transcript_1013/g.1602 Transcript_1013/m.1602 type:complete len:83 (+) Transcript_1013:228-476(+)
MTAETRQTIHRMKRNKIESSSVGLHSAACCSFKPDFGMVYDYDDDDDDDGQQICKNTHTHRQTSDELLWIDRSLAAERSRSV